jgi:hypothetical protein
MTVWKLRILINHLGLRKYVKHEISTMLAISFFFKFSRKRIFVELCGFANDRFNFAGMCHVSSALHATPTHIRTGDSRRQNILAWTVRNILRIWSPTARAYRCSLHRSQRNCSRECISEMSGPLNEGPAAVSSVMSFVVRLSSRLWSNKKLETRGTSCSGVQTSVCGGSLRLRCVSHCRRFL